MRIAFVTNHPLDGDGTPGRAGYQKTAKSMYRSLVDNGFDVAVVVLDQIHRSLASRARERVCRLLGHGYRPHLEPAMLDAYARRISTWLERNRVDLVFSPASTNIAHLDRPEPIVIWRDSTFAGALQAHRNFQNLCRRSIDQGDAMERKALARASLAIFRSEWAAASAINHYGADPRKVKVIPTGGNLDFAVGEADILRHIERRAADRVCRLLFIGIDWASKGGDMALATAQALNARGHATELTIVGCRPAAAGPLPDFVNVLGFLDTRQPACRERLREAILKSHFLLVPSRFEPYGNVFPEVNSLGVPCIATRVGGVTTVIRDGINGQTFPPDATVYEYADYIEANMERTIYVALARRAYLEYRNSLSWERSGQILTGLLHGLSESPDGIRSPVHTACEGHRPQNRAVPVTVEVHV